MALRNTTILKLSTKLSAVGALRLPWRALGTILRDIIKTTVLVVRFNVIGQFRVKSSETFRLTIVFSGLTNFELTVTSVVC